MSKAPSKPRRTAAAAPAPLTLSTAWAAGVLALLTVVFFHQVIVGGMTFVSPDATNPVGFVRVGERSLYQDKVYPLWNPYVFLGMPSFASGAYNPLIYPPDWPLALIARVIPLPELTWMLLYYFLGGLFLFLLAREWGARPEGALLGAAAFVFAPNLVAVGSHGHGSQLVNSAYLPLILWLAARWMRRGGLHLLGWLALAGGFQMLRGHAQIVFYTWLAVGLYLVVDLAFGLARRAEPGGGPAPIPAGTRLARALGVGAAMALAFGIAAFYNLPLRDYARHSIRGGGPDGGVGMEYATAWSLAPWELPTLVIPGAVGFGGETYWGGMPFTDYANVYLGVITLALALPAALGGGGAPRLFALLLAGLALAIALGRHTPLYGFLYQHLPLFNKFRVPVMIVLLLQLAAGLGLAWGWTAVLGEPAARQRHLGRLLGILAVALAGTLVLALVGQEGWREAYVRTALAKRPEIGALAAGAAYQGFVGDLVRACLLGLLGVGLALLAARRKVGAGWASVGALALLLVELWPVSQRVMAPVLGPRAPAAPGEDKDDVIEFLEKAGPPGSFRVLPLAEFQSNRFAGFEVASLGGYHAAKPRLFQDLMDARALDSPAWWRLLNVRFVVSPQPLDLPGLLPVHRGSAYVYALPALPRATVVGRYRVATHPRAILDSIAAGSSDGAELAWLERDPGLELGPVGGARAEIARYALHHVAVEVETPGPALVRLADLWHPDWVAVLDGAPAPVLRADYLLRAVPVPAGRHRVEFRYRSPAVRLGLLVSLGSLAASLGLLAVGILRRRRAGGPEGA
jgi:hypothetical protein